MKRDFALYHVGLRILLRKGNKTLLLRTAKLKFWDLPGGRIDNVENKTPLMRILKREICEELGSRLKYKIGRPAFQFRRFSYSRGVYAFNTVYEARYLSGKIKLSSEHSSYEWVDPKKYPFSRRDFFNTEEYNAFKEYLGR